MVISHIILCIVRYYSIGGQYVPTVVPRYRYCSREVLGEGRVYMGPGTPVPVLPFYVFVSIVVVREPYYSSTIVLEYH
jgi:hypothetical protein